MPLIYLTSGFSINISAKIKVYSVMINRGNDFKDQGNNLYFSHVHCYRVNGSVSTLSTKRWIPDSKGSLSSETCSQAITS